MKRTPKAKSSKASKASKAITPKSLGLVDDVKLSASYRNTRTNFKTVSDVVIGYYITGGLSGSAQAPVRIAPIYRADIWMREGKKGTNYIITSHEIGEFYNPARGHNEEPDRDGDALARIASTTIGALEHHAAWERARRPPERRRKASATATRPPMRKRV